MIADASTKVISMKTLSLLIRFNFLSQEEFLIKHLKNLQSKPSVNRVEKNFAAQQKKFSLRFQMKFFYCSCMVFTIKCTQNVSFMEEIIS